MDLRNLRAASACAFSQADLLGVCWWEGLLAPNRLWSRLAPLSEWLKITGPNLLAPLNQRKRLNNQAVWPVILRLTGPICARAPNLKMVLNLSARGHHDWPVKRVTRPQHRL